MEIAVEKLNETGVNVVNLTCDNPTNNWAMLESLGATLKHDNVQTKLRIRNILNKCILATLDACHLIKLVRNAFGDLQIFKDSNGDTISWVFITELVKIQEEKGLHLATKLRRRHIKFHSDIMSVPLAAQTISNSVADAIDYCRDVLN